MFNESKFISGGDKETSNQVPRKSFLSRFWWIGLVVIILLIWFGVVFKLEMKSGGKAKNFFSKKTNCTTKAAPDPASEGITWILPDCASPLRVSFPYTMDELFANDNTGLVGYGVHAGEHIEGLNHEWIHIKYGTPIRSWADGEVERIDSVQGGESGEVSILINYGQGLFGAHTEVTRSLVKKGDKVKAGQEIAVGWGKDGQITSAEYFLIDENRDDGTVDFSLFSTVSPYDYLREPDKSILIAAYKKNVLDKYIATKNSQQLTFYPYQPYLTNELFFHTGKAGKLSGEWYAADQNKDGDWKDVLTFIEADNPYYTGNLVFSRNNISGSPYSGPQGDFEVDYVKNQIKIVPGDWSARAGGSNNAPTLFGIFEIDESGTRPTLKLEYREGSYPTAFTSGAKNYILRDNGESKK